MLINKYQDFPLATAASSFGFAGPAPLFPRSNTHPKVSTPFIFDELSTIFQPGAGKSAGPSTAFSNTGNSNLKFRLRKIFLFLESLRNYELIMVICGIFNKLSTIRQPSVSPPSAQMSFYKFVIYCLYSIIFLCQPCQPIFQHYIHVRVRACARGNFVYRFLILYFEFVRNRADRADISILARVARCHLG